MKKLILIRHAKSSWNHPQLTDKLRPLNPRGQRDAPAMADWIQTRHQAPDLLISSTAKRALQTAKYFIDSWNVAEINTMNIDSLYHASTSRILDVVHRIDEDKQSAALVGHNPGFTYFVNEILGEIVTDNVPTCGVCVLTSSAEFWSNFDSGTTALSGFYYPRKDLKHYRNN